MDTYGNTVGSRVSLSNQQEEILVGKILGDGCLEKNGRHVRLKIEQTDRQKEYVFWLYQQLVPFVGRSPRAVFHAGLDNKQTKRWRFATLSLSLFDNYKTLFYKEGRKIVPKELVSFLKTPLSLAVWYMDDGYMRTDRSGAYICTSSFTLTQHRQLQIVLRRNFQIDTNIHFAGKYARLHIPARNLKYFVNLIKPYVVDCMKYKLTLTP